MCSSMSYTSDVTYVHNMLRRTYSVGKYAQRRRGSQTGCLGEVGQASAAAADGCYWCCSCCCLRRLGLMLSAGLPLPLHSPPLIQSLFAVLLLLHTLSLPLLCHAMAYLPHVMTGEVRSRRDRSCQATSCRVALCRIVSYITSCRDVSKLLQESDLGKYTQPLEP